MFRLLVCTGDERLAEMLRIVRANGWDRNLHSSQQFKWRTQSTVMNEFDAKYTFYDLGYNLRPTEITGFLGLVQLRYLAENIKKRERSHQMLEEVLKQNSDLIPPDHSHLRVLSGFAFPVLCKTPDLRNHYMSQFSGAGVEIRPMIAGNIQRQPFYAKYVTTPTKLPGADFIHHNGFYCGNYPEMTEMDLETLSSCLKQY